MIDRRGVTQMAVVVGLISFGLFAYLFYALIRPERF
jgi:K+-transporting ATPase KdpF subunit